MLTVRNRLLSASLNLQTAFNKSCTGGGVLERLVELRDVVLDEVRVIETAWQLVEHQVAVLRALAKMMPDGSREAAMVLLESLDAEGPS